MNLLANNVPIVTLDGPSGTGKGTISYLLSKQLGWHFLDSGAIYRVLAYAVRQKNLSWTDEDVLTTLAQQLDLRFETDTEQFPEIYLDGQEISYAIRSEQCGQDASKIAAYPKVRTALLERQRAFAHYPGLVTDGRDMGTVVFPHALLKVFLYASVEERAQRRHRQLKDKGIHVSLATVLEELTERDTRDTNRAHAPLKPANDALQVDTTGLSIVEVFNHILEVVNQRLELVVNN